MGQVQVKFPYELHGEEKGADIADPQKFFLYAIKDIGGENYFA